VPPAIKIGQVIMRKLRILLGVVVVLVVGVQFIRPDRTNPPVNPARTIEANTHLTPEVSAILKRACRDCHSNETRWPWYSNIAPISWQVAGHVTSARLHLNFSDWPAPERNGRRARATDKLGEMCDQVDSGEMPIGQYLWLHPDAKLSPADVRTLCSWTEAERARLKAEAPSGNSSH
jgi:hypothetical protein